MLKSTADTPATQSFPPQLHFQTSPCQMADKITTDVIEGAVIPSVHTLLQKAQVIWTSHVARKPDSRLKKQLPNRDWAELSGQALGWGAEETF